MKPCMVIGASGQVGEHLLNALHQNGQNAVATHHRTNIPGSVGLDIRETESVRHLVESIGPKTIYLAAALTHVDYCEQHPDESYEINVTGTQNIVDAANHAGAKLVYFSSDYIFDGKNGPYSEDAPACPINEYGRQKLAAEHYVALFSHNYLILRTTVVFGWERQGKNFIVRLLNALKSGHEIQVPVDQIGSPTYAPNLAQTSVELAEIGMQGIFNIVGPELCNRYEFACEAARAFSLPTESIRPVRTSELNQAARRPLNAGMKTKKTTAAISSPLIGYRDGLKLMAENKYHPHT